MTTALASPADRADESSTPSGWLLYLGAFVSFQAPSGVRLPRRGFYDIIEDKNLIQFDFSPQATLNGPLLLSRSEEQTSELQSP